MNLLHILNSTFAIPIEQLKDGIVRRADRAYADTHRLTEWLTEQAPVPSWAQRAAATWIIELWMQERDGCEATQLLTVDGKYTRLLRDFSMADIIAIRHSLRQAMR